MAVAIDGVTDEVFQSRLTPAHREIIGWVRGLPGPSAAPGLGRVPRMFGAARGRHGLCMIDMT